MRKRLSKTGEKVRNALAIIYLEDLEKSGHTYGDLLSYIDSKQIQAVVSPIHDRDFFTTDDVFSWCTQHIDPETGDLDVNYLDDAPYVGKPKKPHCHLLIKLPSQQDAFFYTDLLGDCVYLRPSIWEKCHCVTSSIRYFAHMDSPQKAQYQVGMIHGFGGIDMSCLYKRDENQNLKIMARVNKVIKSQGIRYFYQLVDYAMSHNDMDMLSYVRGSSAFYNSIFTSKRFHSYDTSNYAKATK